MSIAEAVSGLVAGGHVRKRSRLSRLVMEYPEVVGTPYTPLTGIPSVLSREVLDAGSDYSITAQDQLAAGQLSLTTLDDTRGTYAAMLQGNDILQVEERYSDGVSMDTGWFTVGMYLIDSITPSADKASSRVEISARDALKWLTLEGLEFRFWADTIRLKGVRLARKVDAAENDSSFYAFVDGSFDNAQERWIQTLNWSDRPLPRIYTDKGKRVSGLDGSLQILYGIGEVLIDTYYYDSKLIYGGLGKPAYLTADYARFLDPTDEREVDIAAMPAGDTLVLSGTATSYDYSTGSRVAVVGPYGPAEWVQGITVLVLTGQAKNTRFRVKRVDVGSRTVVLDRDASVEGLQAADRVRMGEGNRIESVIETLLLRAGFQNIDPAQPFFVSEIVQSQPQLILPTVADFDYTQSKRTNFMRAYQDWQRILPPFTRLYADEDGNVHHANTFQKDLAQYTLSDEITSGSVETSDAEIVTRTIYQVRNRSRLDLCAASTGALQAFTWFTEIPSRFLQVYPTNLQQVDPTDKHLKRPFVYQRVLFDRQGRTGVQIADLEAPNLTTTELDNKLVFMVEFDRAYRLGEIHIRGSSYPYGSSGPQWWQIEYSMDAVDWLLLGDEFQVSDGPLVLTSQQFGEDNIYAKYLRVRLNTPAKFQTQQDDTSQLLKDGIVLTGTVDTRTTPPVTRTLLPGQTPVQNFPVVSRNVIYASMSTFAVYEYDIVEGYAELGVDRFDFLGQVAASGPDYIDGATLAEFSWIDKTILCHNLEMTVTGTSGVRVFVSGANPAAGGVVAGDGFLVVGGERDEDFERDVERRQRLGRRTKVIDPIDEVGFYIVESLVNAGFHYTLDDYARDKAKENLGELSREFLPCNAKSVRPDARLRDTAYLDLRRLDFQGNVFVRDIRRSADGSVELKATPFRDAGWGTVTSSATSSTTLTTTPVPLPYPALRPGPFVVLLPAPDGGLDAANRRTILGEDPLTAWDEPVPGTETPPPTTTAPTTPLTTTRFQKLW